MAQSKKMSLVEATTQSVVAFMLSIWVNLYALPWWGFHDVTLADSIGITVLMTVISFVRGYIVRRFFETTVESLFEAWKYVRHYSGR